MIITGSVDFFLFVCQFRGRGYKKIKIIENTVKVK